MGKMTRTGKLRLMYLYTLAGAGGFGAVILFKPGMVESLLKMPVQDPIIFSITGSVFLAFGLLSISGLIAPVKFSPILLLQFVYKTVWMIFVMTFMISNGQFPTYAILIAVIFATYIVADLLILPWGYLFSGNVS